jgi:restriction endonuclease Mrr
MNAKDARKITNAALETRSINTILDTVYAQIKQTAQKGNEKLVNPLKGVQKAVTQEQKEAVADVLKKAGYKVAVHENGDMEVSW